MNDLGKVWMCLFPGGIYQRFRLTLVPVLEKIAALLLGRMCLEMFPATTDVFGVVRSDRRGDKGSSIRACHGILWVIETLL